MRSFSLVFPIIRPREIATFILVGYANAAFVFRRRHREDDHVLHAGDSHEADDGTAAEEKCPRHSTQQDPQGRGSGWRDKEADKGHEDRREFRGRAECGESVRKCCVETDEEPGENEMTLGASNSSTTLRSHFFINVRSLCKRFP